MTLPVVIEDPARDDLADAVRWYKRIRPGLEADFRLCVRATLERPARGVRRARIDRFPFAIFYRSDDSALRVFAVLHTSRDPRTWHARGH